jgi:2-hydroxycyclohexanecarboxyl-CoA dehydrogenase
VETELLGRVTVSANRKASLVAGVTVKRASKPEEIAQTIMFQASDRSEFITGQVLSVKGSKTAR